MKLLKSVSVFWSIISKKKKSFNCKCINVCLLQVVNHFFLCFFCSWERSLQRCCTILCATAVAWVGWIAGPSSQSSVWRLMSESSIFDSSVRELYSNVDTKGHQICFYSCLAAVGCWAAGLSRCVCAHAQAETEKLRRATSGKTRRPKPWARPPLLINVVSLRMCVWNKLK